MATITSPHPDEIHRSQRSGWLRAAVLGVNDGVVSTASLMLGVLSSAASKSAILVAGVAGLVAGALSMAVGEYVSVSSQRDSEEADVAIERRSLAKNPAAELNELAEIYRRRGLEPQLAHTVAEQLHAFDAVNAHARDELGIDQATLPNPLQAATASAISFALGAFVPVLATLISSRHLNARCIVALSLIALAVSGIAGAAIGGGHRLKAASRVLIGGAAAMAVTAIIGHLIGSGL